MFNTVFQEYQIPRNDSLCFIFIDAAVFVCDIIQYYNNYLFRYWFNTNVQYKITACNWRYIFFITRYISRI